MSEHYTLSTYEVGMYCSTCGRITAHKVDNGRQGHCLEHQKPVKMKQPRAKQLSMFDTTPAEHR